MKNILVWDKELNMHFIVKKNLKTDNDKDAK